MEIPQEERPAVAPLHSELLVEIAIIDFAAPPDAEGVAAHEIRNRRGIKCLDQQLHISVQFSAVPEPGCKPADGYVGDRAKAVEIDIKMAFQFPFVVGLELGLIRREEGAIGIVNEVEGKVVVATVAELVEELEGLDTGTENTVAPLSVDVFGFIAGHGGDDFHTMGGEKASQPLVAAFKQNGEIAAIDNGFDVGHFAKPLDQIPEVWNHLRRAACEVHRVDVRAFEPGEDTVKSVAVDDFFPIRTCVYMAVNTGEIAAFADVDLKDLGAPAAERQTVIAQNPGKSRHCRVVESLRICHFTIEPQSSWIIPESSGLGALPFRQRKGGTFYSHPPQNRRQSPNRSSLGVIRGKPW